MRTEFELREKFYNLRTWPVILISNNTTVNNDLYAKFSLSPFFLYQQNSRIICHTKTLCWVNDYILVPTLILLTLIAIMKKLNGDLKSGLKFQPLNVMMFTVTLAS